MAIPIMVIYTFSNSILLPIFLYSIGVCLIVVSIITERTLLYGRRILYVYMQSRSGDKLSGAML